MQAVDVQAVQVAAGLAVDHDGHARPHAANVAWNVRRGEGQQVLAAKASVHVDGECARAVGRQVGGKGIHVHLEGQQYVGRRSLQAQVGQGDAHAVHVERPFSVGNG